MKVVYLYPMKKLFLLCAFITFCCYGFAQENIEQLHENAREFMKQGDYANASVILVRAAQQEPQNLALAKDLAFTFYMQKDMDRAIRSLLPFFEKNEADDQAYQIGALIYRASANIKEAEKLYRKAIKIYPQSGPLYNDYGEFLQLLNDANAIKTWEKGIQEDPSFSGNYYHAAKYYNQTDQHMWTLLFGEIFINLESFTARTTEMKNILFQGYKKLFSTVDLLKNARNANKFERTYLKAMNKQNDVVAYGIDVETLTMVRTRFILEWYTGGVPQMPFALFDWHERLLTAGLFPAYNQWIFGGVQSLSGYQNWTQTHKKEYEAFHNFQRSNLFKTGENQFYR